MVHVRLLDHGAHRLRSGPVGELEIRVLFPDGLQVEVGTSDILFQMHQVPRMRDRLIGSVEVGLAWYGEFRRLCCRIRVYSEALDAFWWCGVWVWVYRSSDMIQAG